VKVTTHLHLVLGLRTGGYAFNGAQGQLCNFYLPQLVILSVHMAYCSRKKLWSLVGLSTDVGYNKKGTVQFFFFHQI
jgi:hypothetical protein